ncbi:MAG: TRAP transporter large permease [Bacteroidetes bacterium]|nr:TRAP transporter large permease [Bacteroidota bacterium]
MEIIEILILVISFVILLSVGVPISFSIGISSLLTMLMSINTIPSFTTISQRMATGLDSFALLAIPFFILAGQLMNVGGIARRLINFAKILVGKLPGGLAFVNIMAAMMFGAISGSAVAAASAIGGFMAPVMKKEGYNESFSAAVNITSATTGMIIPPSNILIVYSLASGGVSIAALFLAGYVPGILLGLSLMIVAFIYAKKNKYKVNYHVTFGEAVKTFFDAIPSLLLIIIVIGGIVAGYFTATEASAVAVLYAFILSVFIYKEVKLKDLYDILLTSASTTAIVMLLIGTSMAMSWVMAYENIPQNVAEALITLSNNKIIILIIINLILLFVGVFMDMTPAVLIFTPIFLPVAQQLGIDPIHFGIIMVMNLSIGLCTPPVGSVLFVGCSVANLPIAKVIKPLIPLFIAMIVTLMFVTYLPELSLTVPRWFGY